MIKVGKYQQALNIIAEKLPLPGVIGRICPHPCEHACRRAEIDEPISIRLLKRFAADTADLSKVPVSAVKDRPAEVVIIGSGPAGLSCAYHLIKKGIRPIIYEALPEPGGMLRVGIPDYRLPKQILKKEIEYIQELGVEIKTNTPIKDIKELLNKYKAIFIATGTHKPISLNIPGEDAQGVIQGVEFLKKVNMKEAVTVGKKVCVIGGGNVAIDAARTALRLGAEQVEIIYRRTREEMPALKEEIEAAEKEGIKITYLTAPTRVIEEAGKIKAIECIKMKLGEPDSSGRRRPIPIPGTEHQIPTQQLIVAIGQRPDTELLSSFGVELNPNGTIKVDPITYETSIKGVFAGGDVQTGPDIAIRAISAGMEAAESIKRYINKEDLKEGREKEQKSENLRPIPEKESKKKRTSVAEIPLEQRKTSFREVELGYTEQIAQKEAERCINCGYCCECFQCVEVCKAEAIDHSQQEQEIEIETGAVIFSSGAKVFDPKKQQRDFYPDHPNILTSLEFERILSASGPTMGKLLRPSDGKEPKKIAWLQCVGSRDVNTHTYCSAVCCMYAIKEAVIAKEHASEELDCAIFYMDMRTYGKEYEKYYERAKEEGVRFIRCRIHTIYEKADTGNLILRYVDENGEINEEEFDMVVLSVGFEISDESQQIAKLLNIKLTDHGFYHTSSFSPVSLSKQGMYVCGVLSDPKDIPSSVIEASAASCEAQVLLTESRGTLIKKKEIPPERNVLGERPKIGVFICHCGINIGGVINIEELKEYTKKLPFVEYVEDNLYTCSQDTQDRITEVIKEKGLNRIVVAACTPRTHEPLFQETLINAGLNKYLFEMVNIRNQDSWVHKDWPKEATEKAKDLIRMAVVKVALMEPLKEEELGINKDVLVIGGGIAGMTAAKSLSAQGFKVYLVERSSQLGGQARNIFHTWKGDKVQERLDQLITEVLSDNNIQVYLDSDIEEVEGFVGNFKTKIKNKNKEYVVEHGAVVIATGAKEYKPKEYMYGKDSRIITGLELDKKLLNGEDLSNVKSAVFIQCVGSREPERPYCSKVCCTQSIKNALYLKEKYPEMDIYVLYRDIRTYGEREDLYLKARRKGVIFIRYSLSNKPEVNIQNGIINVRVQDHILKRDILIEADLVVLASAIVPYENDKLAQLFKVPLNEEGLFVESHPKLAPSEFATDGVFLCGMAHYPKPIEEAIAQAKASISRAMTLLTKDKIFAEGNISVVDPMLCAGCGVCVSICPYGAPYIMEEGRFAGKAAINPVLCKGCGLCVASCRSGAINLNGFRTEQIMSMINELGAGL